MWTYALLRSKFQNKVVLSQRVILCKNMLFLKPFIVKILNYYTAIQPDSGLIFDRMFTVYPGS